MFLFIGESLGMQELILIGVIALIVFGPRKLPQMARTIGKMMSEFRKATNDFKSTWEKEVDFEDFKEEKPVKIVSPADNSIAKNPELKGIQIAAPEIKEIKQFDFENGINHFTEKNGSEKQPIKVSTGKQDWL